MRRFGAERPIHARLPTPRSGRSGGVRAWEVSGPKPAQASSGGSALSPQTRRGRTGPVSHRKSSSRVAAAAAAAVKPAASTEPIEGQQVAEVKPATARHGRRKRDLGHVKKSSGYRYLTELFGAYTPLLIAFVVLLDRKSTRLNSSHA